MKQNTMADMQDSDEFYLEIFVSHGKNPLWRQVVDFVELELQHQVAAFEELPSDGTNNLAQLDDITDECSFAVVVVTADDGRSRESLIHEIGFHQGKFGCENVLVLIEQGVADFPLISGLVTEKFNGADIKTTFNRIRKEIEAAIIRFESDDEEDDD